MYKIYVSGTVWKEKKMAKISEDVREISQHPVITAREVLTDLWNVKVQESS